MTADSRAETVVEIAVDADVFIAKREAIDLARAIGFDDGDRELIALAVFELARNVRRHAGTGEVCLVADGDVLEVIATDHGPGIPSIDQAVTDGYSRDGGLGYGLGTVNRAMDEMRITSSRLSGTTVIARRRLRPAVSHHGPSRFDIGVASAAKPGFHDNGDTYVVKRWGAIALFGVIDGLGHGAAAQAAALAARHYVEGHSDLPLDAVFRGTGIACRGTRGVVMALGRIDASGPTLEFASVGNIEARVFGGSSPSAFVVRRGVIGHHAPEPKVTVTPWPAEATLIMFSDGILSRWPEFSVEAALASGASAAAASLLHRLSRQTDDATVLVARLAG